MTPDNNDDKKMTIDLLSFDHGRDRPTQQPQSLSMTTTTTVVADDHDDHGRWRINNRLRPTTTMITVDVDSTTTDLPR